MHTIVTTVSDLDCQYPCWKVGHTVFERVYQGWSLTVVTTVTYQIVVNGQDMDFKWLVDG